MHLYDKFYAKTSEVLLRKYDFIVASEVVEHLYTPAYQLKRLLSMIKPEGQLGIMTKLARDQKSFANWHYKNDPTHICFYSQQTFKWMAKSWSLKLNFIGEDVIIMCKTKFS